MTRSLSTLKTMFLIGTFALVVSAARDASAQNQSHVNVPFAFTANHHQMPAGYYEVLASETSLTLVNVNSRKIEAIFLTRKESGDAIETRGRMEFYVSGSRHVLTQVQFAGSSMHSMLLGQPKRERIVARNASATIELAMR
jgi:copper(I)-binding protein